MKKLFIDPELKMTVFCGENIVTLSSAVQNVENSLKTKGASIVGNVNWSDINDSVEITF